MFLAKGIEKALFAAIYDPDAVEECSSKTVGDMVDICIGGSIDNKSEKTVMKDAVIKRLTLDLAVDDPKTLAEDKPKSCVLSFKGVDILVFNKRKPVFTEETLNEHGLSLYDYNVLVVKQGYLSPELLEAASNSVLALTPGNCSQKVKEIAFKKLRRPIYPLDGAEEVSRLIDLNERHYLNK